MLPPIVFTDSIPNRNLKGLNKHFRVGRQEDAHEFLRHLIDVLQNACLKVVCLLCID